MKERRGLESARSVDNVRRREFRGRPAARVVNNEGASGGMIGSVGGLPDSAAAAASASFLAFCLRLCGRSCVLCDSEGFDSIGFASVDGSTEVPMAAEVTESPLPIF